MTRGTNPHDPTDERTSDMSTPTASGLSGGRPEGAGAEPARSGEDEPIVDRTGDHARRRTPRRYEETDQNPTLPSDDATLGTKM